MKVFDKVKEFILMQLPVSEDKVTMEARLIDDLGAEPMLQKITGEILFTLINERQNASRATILSTNFTRSDLGARYGERLVSRITDRRIASVFLLEGKDLRQQR